MRPPIGRAGRRAAIPRGSRRRDGDLVWLWVQRAQVPIGIAALAVGAYDIATGFVVLGLIVITVGVTAAALAVSRLRR